MAHKQSLTFKSALLPAGWADNVTIHCEDGWIIEVQTGCDKADTSGIALPGLASLHSHSFQRAMAGLAETRGPGADSFWSWRTLMYRFLEVLNADDIEAIAAYAFMEMLEGGFTAVGEFHYLHHATGGVHYANIAEHGERIAAAASLTGIGLTLLPVIYACAGFGKMAPAEGQKRFITDSDSFSRLYTASQAAISGLADASIGIAPHSLRAVDPPALERLLQMHPSGPVHMHIAEQMREVEDCMAWCGQRPVEWLYDHAEINARWCLIHATHMTPQESAQVARSGAVAGLCPVTEASLGDGIFDAPALLAQGGIWGVGSDSNIEISASGELRMLEYSQRLALQRRNVFAGQTGESTGGALYRGAVAGGARALNRCIAGIEKGCRADFVVLDAHHPDLIAKKEDGWIDSYIFVTGARAIDRVYAGGVLRVTGGQHVAHEEITRRYSKTIARLMQS